MVKISYNVLEGKRWKIVLIFIEEITKEELLNSIERDGKEI